ncbi:(Fe-S)-binding protein [Occallatibacter riparius]|uniref:(Fe-S)-binding protein n=1 Tax=Occallatibacter riparius TaxID=1002689 RepID=A0A9J7BJ88_9BACT|nr:(Fe-S)-binding protein [Occallatibacter riparius]UWZ82888.1 (Fe-S)-binding protein [Occallatibacter riparius]
MHATLAEPQSFSLTEKLIFLILAATSLGLFFRRFGPILKRILASKKDPDFKLAPVGRRVWDFFTEVICQAKVIKQRPLPGLAHAFVFWGFCAFALVTLNHAAVGLGIGFLDPAGVFGRFYYYLAAAFAIACAVGIAGLFVRRFFARPRWLGAKVSYESGVIAWLIFVLMLTYLAAFFTTKDSADARTLWWLHTVTLLAFLPIIPHTKHLHLVLSPATIFLSRGGFSKIPPLVGDEDFGLVTGKDLTQLVSLQAYSCVECGRCSEHCPATNTGKELNPKEVILGLRGYLNHVGPASEDALLNGVAADGTYGNHVSQKAVFQCTTCGACEFQCPVGIEHLPIMVGLRRGAVNTGTWEDDYGAKLFNQLERGSNALGISALERDKFVQKSGFPIFDGTQEYCLWLGCMGAYDPKGREIVTAFAQVMNYLGTSFGVLKKEKCTGDPVRRLGNDLVFQTLAEENLKNLAQNKVKKIVSICPHCVRTIQEDWKAYGTPPEIEHHTEFMARFADRLPKQNSGGKVVYHDPCYLGRYRDVYEQPRELVQISATLVEAPRHKERSFCCGAGGGLVFLGEETGDRVSHTRAKELVATGAQAIGTACPFCNSMFRDALGEMDGTAPELMDVAQLVARGLPAKEQTTVRVD